MRSAESIARSIVRPIIAPIADLMLRILAWCMPIDEE